MRADVAIPAAFAEFMEVVVDILDGGDEDDLALLDGDDLLQVDDGYGGRDGDKFTFVFFPEGKDEKWTVVLTEDAVRMIADGDLDTIPAEVEPYKRKPGAPLPLPAKKAGPAKDVGRALLDALLDQELLSLQRQASRSDLAAWLEKQVYDALDAPDLDDEERGALLVEALIENPMVDEVFGDDLEILRLARELAGD